MLEPLIRDGREGRGHVPPGELGRGARPGRRRLRDAIAARGGGDGAAVLLHGHDGLAAAPLDERPVLQRARGERPRPHDLRHRRDAPGWRSRTASRPRSIPSAGRAARYILCWGWNPMSTAPHLWRQILAARRAGAKLVVVDPFRSRTARVADEHLRPLPGHRRRARARDDARDRRRRPAGRRLVPGAHDGLRGAARAAGRLPGRALRGAVRRAGGDDRPDRVRVRVDPALAAAARRRRAAPPGRPDRLPHARLPAGARRAPGGTRAAAARTSRRRRRGRDRPARRLRRPDLRPGPVRDDQHVAARATR